jgi:hypothetical protein
MEMGRTMKHVELIIDYIVDGDDFQYCDNTGRLIRCKDCKFRERFEGGEFYCCGLDDEPLAVDDTDFCSWAMPKD